MQRNCLVRIAAGRQSESIVHMWSWLSYAVLMCRRRMSIAATAGHKMNLPLEPSKIIY